MNRRIVVTGTDTGVGKTVFSAGLADLLGASYWKRVLEPIMPKEKSPIWHPFTQHALQGEKTKVCVLTVLISIRLMVVGSSTQSRLRSWLRYS